MNGSVAGGVAYASPAVLPQRSAREAPVFRPSRKRACPDLPQTRQLQSSSARRGPLRDRGGSDGSITGVLTSLPMMRQVSGVPIVCSGTPAPGPPCWALVRSRRAFSRRARLSRSALRSDGSRRTDSAYVLRAALQLAWRAVVRHASPQYRWSQKSRGQTANHRSHSRPRHSTRMRSRCASRTCASRLGCRARASLRVHRVERWPRLDHRSRLTER